jgi:hypothetical protein
MQDDQPPRSEAIRRERSKKARDEFIEVQAEAIVKRSKGTVTKRVARETVSRQCRGELLPLIVLPFDDPDDPQVLCRHRWVVADPQRSRCRGQPRLRV